MNAATIEIIAAAVLGLTVLWLVLSPFLAGAKPARIIMEPPLPEETPQGQALLALKEIEFDRETGKLSDADYEMLKARYTTRALAALRDEPGSAAAPGPACPTCGLRPEEDAVFCSSCGGRLSTGRECRGCGSAVADDASFCEACGQSVAA